MLVFSNKHVSGGFSIFATILNTVVRVSHWFVTPIKGYRVMNYFVSLVGFGFSVDVYG